MSTSCSRCGLLHPQGTPCFALALPETRNTRELQPGVLLAGRYLLLRTLHHGGMSVVYLAEDTIQNRQVAIKELRLPEGSSDEETHEAEAWFARESYLLSTLDHPLIPRFYSVFREDERSYLVQEFVAGENLEQLIATEGPAREDLVLRWARDLCDLLDYLHHRPEPVIFRDLKPANMMLRAVDQALVVVDFGIARPYHQGQVGTVVGTPGYAPPEQYQGLATPQSDIYALGASMHRLLTGHDVEHAQPFSFPPVLERNPQVSPAMAALVERALALNPAERFQSAVEMSEALEDMRAWPLGGRFRGGWSSGRATRAGASAINRRLWSGLAVAVVLAPLVLRAAAGTQLSAPTYSGQRGLPLITDMMYCAPLGASAALPGTPLHPGMQIATGGNALWFTDHQGAALDYLTPSGQVGSCLFAPGTPAPQELISGGDGNLWLIEANGAAIDRVTGQGTLQLTVPAGSDAAAQLTVAQDGTPWFTQPATGSIVRIDGNNFGQRFPLPAGGGAPEAIVVSGSSIWFTLANSNRIGRSSAQGIVLFNLPPQPLGVAAIAAGAGDSAWFTAAAANRIGHIMPNGAVVEYPVPTPHAGLGAITASPDGSFWFVEQHANKIGHITATGAIQEFTIPTPHSLPASITMGPDGAVWFTEWQGQRLGRIGSDGTVTEIAPIVGVPNVFNGTGASQHSTPYFSANAAPAGQ